MPTAGAGAAEARAISDARGMRRRRGRSVSTRRRQRMALATLTWGVNDALARVGGAGGGSLVPLARFEERGWLEGGAYERWGVYARAPDVPACGRRDGRVAGAN